MTTHKVTINLVQFILVVFIIVILLLAAIGLAGLLGAFTACLVEAFMYGWDYIRN